ncbi:hypothetical protein GCM10009837_77080 [Streptomyces durmitorensis]
MHRRDYRAPTQPPTQRRACQRRARRTDGITGAEPPPTDGIARAERPAPTGLPAPSAPQRRDCPAPSPTRPYGTKGHPTPKGTFARVQSPEVD